MSSSKRFIRAFEVRGASLIPWTKSTKSFVRVMVEKITPAMLKWSAISSVDGMCISLIEDAELVGNARLEASEES
jgi:hypothetical protein